MLFQIGWDWERVRLAQNAATDFVQADFREQRVSPNDIQVVSEARRESAGDVDSGERRVSGDCRSRAVCRRAGGDPSAIETLLQWGDAAVAEVALGPPLQAVGQLD